MPQRPTYTEKTAETLLHRLRDGRSLRAVCAGGDMPARSTVLQWAADDRHGFAARYQAALQAGRARRGSAPLPLPEIAGHILHELSLGRALLEICRDDGMPAYGTVRHWVTTDRCGFAVRYRAAVKTGNARRGRPTVYAAPLAEIILNELVSGRTLDSICADPGMPAAATVKLWAKRNREGFAPRYRRARLVGCYELVDQILEIADDSRGDRIERRASDGSIVTVGNPGNIRRARLRIAVRRWLVARLLPRLLAEQEAAQHAEDQLAELLQIIIRSKARSSAAGQNAPRRSAGRDDSRRPTDPPETPTP